MQSVSVGRAQAHPLGGAGWLASLAHRACDLLRRMWDAYWQARMRRATALMLQALDDRTLKDIGLSRSEIVPAVYGGDGCAPRFSLGRRHEDQRSEDAP